MLLFGGKLVDKFQGLLPDAELKKFMDKAIALTGAGEAGAGQAAKICNNMLLGIVMTGTSEALRLGAAHGVSPEALSRIMQTSSGDNWVLQK